MIEFESIGVISMTKTNGLIVGEQIGTLKWGLLTMYGATCEGMGFESFVMTVKLSFGEGGANGN